MTPALILAAALACTSPHIVDGDTLRCAGERVRLLGIDAPELPGHCRKGRACTPGDPYAAKAHLRALTKGKRVVCEWSQRDPYGRPLARCNAAGIDLSCAMLASGHAEARYSPIDCGKAEK